MKFLVPILFVTPFFAFGADVHEELKETVRAEVLEILSEETRDIIGTDADALVQEVKIRVREGKREGEIVTFENDLMRLEKGEYVYVNRLETIDGIEYYTFKDADRRYPLILLGALFVATLLIFSGFHGVRAILSLGASIVVIFAVLVPLLLAGHSPALVSVGVGGVMLALTLFLTHGVNTGSVVAFLGTFGAIVITTLLSLFFVSYARLTGLSSDEAIFLNFSTKGALDFGGLLLGSIVIGIIGILDDVAITQASVVRELRRANQKLRGFELFERALRVGRDHVGSLVNTLSLAYVGVALPLILLLVKAESSLTLSLNQEIVAVELIRIFLGSIGLIITVPLTTLIASYWYQEYASEDGGAEAHHHHVH